MDNVYVGKNKVSAMMVGNTPFICQEVIVDAITLRYTLSPDSTGWKVSDTGNVVVNSGNTPDGEVHASNHIHLGGTQSISIKISPNTKSITYFSYNDNTHKTTAIDLPPEAGQNLVMNGDFSDGLNHWNPTTGENHTWSHITPDGCQLDMPSIAEFATCTATMTQNIPAGTECILKWETEIIDDFGNTEDDLLSIHFNDGSYRFYTRGGVHEKIFTAPEEIWRFKLSWAGEVVKGVFRKIELMINSPLGVTISESCSSILKLNKELVSEDIPYLNAHPNCIIEMLNDIEHPGISITKQDIIDGGGYYPGNEGVDGGASLPSMV